MSVTLDPGAALHGPVPQGAYAAMTVQEADRFARRLVLHAASSGTWQPLADHLAALKAAMPKDT